MDVCKHCIYYGANVTSVKTNAACYCDDSLHEGEDMHEDDTCFHFEPI